MSLNTKKNRWMRTRAFGPPSWYVFHSYAMSYPLNHPKPSDRKLYKSFYTIFGKVLPCSLCQKSYAKFIKQCPMDRKVLSSRRNLVFWTFKIHNLVNKKLGCKLLTKVQMERKYKYYERFRASSCSKKMSGCTKAKKNNRNPKRTKIVCLDDKKAKKKTKK